METRCLGNICPGRSDSRNSMDFPLAMAYVPWQEFEEVENPEEGFRQGTIFKQLYKPFTGRRWGK